MTMSLLLMVLGALLETHTSFLFASGRQDRAIEARSVNRLAVSELAGLVRAADMIWPPPGTSAARTELTMTVPRKDGRGNEVIRLRLASESRQILRETLDQPDGRVLASRIVALGAVAGATPFVRYFDSAGEELDPEKLGVTATLACAMRFQLSVAIETAPGRGPVLANASATPRNLRFEELTC